MCMLQACAGAEAAYVRALEAASKVPLVGHCDGASLRAALDGFSDLPFMVGQVGTWKAALGQSACMAFSTDGPHAYKW
jgi:hypothetical protein